MNKNSCVFNNLILFAMAGLLGLLLPFLRPDQPLLNPTEAKIESILLKESNLLTGELKKDFVPYLVATAEDHEVDPLLVLAVMKVESTFKPDAISYAGAYGLLQIKPVAAQEVGGRPMAKRELLDPYQNVQVGIQYLSYLKKMFRKDRVRMLSAYNMGPTLVRNQGVRSSRYSRKVMAAYQKFLSHDPAMLLAKQ